MAGPDRDGYGRVWITASGGVIMAGVSGEASLTVTLGYDVASRPAAATPPEVGSP